jgi:hypothetical protein
MSSIKLDIVRQSPPANPKPILGECICTLCSLSEDVNCLQ